MDEKQGRLSSADEAALRQLLGRPLLRLLAPSIEVSGLWAAVPSLSIPCGWAFIVIVGDCRSSWDGTYDEYVLRASQEDAPRGIPLIQDERGRRRIGYPCSIVNVGAPKSPVVEIKVLSLAVDTPHGTLTFDGGLLFRREDDRRLALVVRQSIVGGLECATRSEAIEEALTEYSVRVVLN